MIKIEILLSTYNGEKYLKDQLQSILSQKGNFELDILIRDDGSTDNTKKILEEYKLLYKNIKVIYGCNLGWMKSFNKLIFLSDEADYYAFSDQDDVWMPDKIKKGLEKIENISMSKPVLYGSNVIETNDELLPLKKSKNKVRIKLDFLSVLLCSFTLGCTMIFNDEAKRLYTYSPKEMKFVGHDWLLATLCASFGILILDENAYIYHRRHGSNESGDLKFKKILLSKISHFKNGKIGYTVYQELYNGYKENLTKKEVKILYNFINYKVNLKSKICLLINPKIKKYTFKGTVLLKAAILFNRYI